MKRQIDLDKAADAEIFGALAARSNNDKSPRASDSSSLTEAQVRTVAKQARSLVRFALRAGAARNPIIIGDIALTLKGSGSRQTLSITAEPLEEKFIAIGSRGTAFAILDSRQMEGLRLNSYNQVLKKTHRSPEQKAKRDSGEHQGVLWADSCSWITPRGGRFWIGTLNEALAQRLVRKARIKTKRGARMEEFMGYVRADFDQIKSARKSHKVIAVEGKGGRIEVTPVRKENSNGHRNAAFLCEVLAVDLECDG
jgi:hypothetical protein